MVVIIVGLLWNMFIRIGIFMLFVMIGKVVKLLFMMMVNSVMFM